MKILIIEDSKIDNQILYDLLKCKYEIDRAYDGDDGLKRLKNNNYDLVVLDIILPGYIEGIAIINYIEEERYKNKKNIKIIAISGGGVYLGKYRCLEMAKACGADRIVEKPINEQFIEEVDELLGI